jgi:hypothetical protein
MPTLQTGRGPLDPADRGPTPTTPVRFTGGPFTGGPR